MVHLFRNLLSPAQMFWTSNNMQSSQIHKVVQNNKAFFVQAK